jgi:hypothetical protein
MRDSDPVVLAFPLCFLILTRYYCSDICRMLACLIHASRKQTCMSCMYNQIGSSLFELKLLWFRYECTPASEMIAFFVAHVILLFGLCKVSRRACIITAMFCKP